MHRPNAFSRINVLMAAMAALAAGAFSGMPGVKAASPEHAYNLLGGYRSRGKRKTRSHAARTTLVPKRARKPVNKLATELYHANCAPGTTHEIVGDVAVVPDFDFA